MKFDHVFFAARRNDLKTVKLFIEKKGVPPTITNDYPKKTLAHVAVEQGYLDMLKYLVEKDPSLLKFENPESSSTVKYLVESCNADIYEELKFWNPDKDGYCTKHTAINLAVCHGRLNIVKYFVEEAHADINKSNKSPSNGTWKPPGGLRPLLSDAVIYNRWDIITYLIDEKKSRFDCSGSI